MSCLHAYDDQLLRCVERSKRAFSYWVESRRLWALLAFAFCNAEASAAHGLLPNGPAHQPFFLLSFFSKSE
jgi:hypothetical protein